jgi:hypothetical protein
MKLAEVTGWVEDHPTESIVIGAGGLIALLWLLGFFSSSSSSSSSGASNLASAYYAAEAQQAVVGGQIQMATIQTAGATAQNAANANAAVAINAAQTGAATTINGQNASTTALLGNDQLLATYSSNAAAVSTNQSNNDAALAITNSNNLAQATHDMLGTIVPQELALTGGSAAFDLPGGQGTSYVDPSGGPGVNINTTVGMGYTLAQAQKIAGVA